jgi:ribonucleoside-diphosphate reductase alpha chain
VRCGHKVREDGTRVPLWHDSEVAAIAWAIQNILDLRARRQGTADQLALPLPDMPEPSPTEPAAGTQVMAGKKCPDCGAHAVIKKDGCDYCTQCGFVGSCG